MRAKARVVERGSTAGRESHSGYSKHTAGAKALIHFNEHDGTSELVPYPNGSASRSIHFPEPYPSQRIEKCQQVG